MKFIQSIIISFTMIVSNILFGQTEENKFEKLSISYLEATTDSNFKIRTRGLEAEYYKNLHRWYGISFSLEGSYYNNIPNRAKVPSEIDKKQNTSFETTSISQFIISSHFYANFINNKKNFLYLSAGLGYNLQSITYQYNFPVNSYAKNTKTLVSLFTLGYDYALSHNYSIGLNLRGQLPLIRDKDFFRTSGGYNELMRFGLKFGKFF